MAELLYGDRYMEAPGAAVIIENGQIAGWCRSLDEALTLLYWDATSSAISGSFTHDLYWHPDDAEPLIVVEVSAALRDA